MPLSYKGEVSFTDDFLQYKALIVGKHNMCCHISRHAYVADDLFPMETRTTGDCRGPNWPDTTSASLVT